jgi:hypothetical protein
MLDSGAAEKRRVAAEAQVEKTRMGTLGVDIPPQSPTDSQTS